MIAEIDAVTPDSVRWRFDDGRVASLPNISVTSMLLAFQSVAGLPHEFVCAPRGLFSSKIKKDGGISVMPSGVFRLTVEQLDELLPADWRRTSAQAIVAHHRALLADSTKYLESL